MKKKIRNRIIATIVIISILSTVGLIYYYGYGPGKAASVDLPAGSGTFSIVALDGSRGEELDLGDVSANLYLLPDHAVDLTGGDWSEFENQTAVDTLSEIDEDDLKVATHVMAVVVYWCIDTDIDGSTAQEDQNVAYYQRETRIYADRLNTIYLYETPENGAQLTCYNTDTMAVINTATTNITSYPCVNFTMAIMATNMTAFSHHQAYVSYWSYILDDWADLSLTLTMNTTCVKQEFTVSGGLSIDRPTTTTLAYSWNYLDAIAIQTYHFAWHVNVTGTFPTSMDLLVVNAVTPPVLAFNGVTI